MLAHLVTIFPEFFESALKCSILRIAQDRQALQVDLVNLRDFTRDSYRTVDDYPFGGGAGMVMKPEPIFEAVRGVATPSRAGNGAWTVLLSPRGRKLTQSVVQELARRPRLILVCGHYKGVDERVGEFLADDEISVGDYILSGGEVAGLVLLEAVARLLPGVVGDEESVNTDSFSNGLLDAPWYTRPRDYEGHEVPEVLVSGDHDKIRRWRRKQSLEITRDRRPDLFAEHALSAEDKKLLEEDA
jgi:tRNA (guanine37-N1)-methyltransferase